MGAHQIARVENRHLRDSLARQEIVKQIRHVQKPLGYAQQRRFVALHRQQLEQRTYRPGFIRGQFENSFSRHRPVRVVVNAVGSAVAIAHRIAQQFAVAAEQAEVHAPGIDANASRHDAAASADADAREHLSQQGWEVPVYRAAHVHTAVGEAMDFLHLNLVADKRHDDPPATLSPEIKG